MSGLLLGAALDSLAGDPATGHPVAVFGSAASRAERRCWAASRARGAVFTAACVAPVACAGWLAHRLARRMPAGGTAVTAAAAWAVLGGTSLAGEASAISSALAAGDLAGARRKLPALCGRDPARLDEPELARATVESVAENTCDAVVAPLLWGAVFGVPGLLGYRAVNTLDAMIGHRSPRYESFGWAAARLDDAANLLPARVTALLAVGLAPAAGGSPRRALRVLRRDGRAHPSPNAGRCEAAFAGALDVRLGGTNVYAGRTERRGLLGNGPSPGPADIDRAVRLSRLAGAGATVMAALIAAGLHSHPERKAAAAPRSRLRPHLTTPANPGPRPRLAAQLSARPRPRLATLLSARPRPARSQPPLPSPRPPASPRPARPALRPHRRPA